jgi:hypothetical protein
VKYANACKLHLSTLLWSVVLVLEMLSMMYSDVTVYALLPRKDDLLNGSVR